MPRASRHRQGSAAPYYHVLNRGHNREVVFRDAADHRYFLDLLARYGRRGTARLYHYCLMSNHFHLLLRCERVEDLSPWIAGLLRAYVHYYHRRYGFVGHLWQGRFRSPAVAAEDYFLSCARYLERNPVAAGVVAEPWQYPWSSCPAYALGVADPLLSYNVWYQGLGGDPEARQGRWREFLLGDDPREAAVATADWVAGSDAERRRLYRPQARPARRRGRPRQAPAGQEGHFPEFYEATGEP
jgi:putative transposase